MTRGYCVHYVMTMSVFGLNRQDVLASFYGAERVHPGDLAAMLQHPVVQAAISLYSLPVVQAGLRLEGSEEQQAFLETWFREYYPHFVQVYRLGLAWGRAMGEVVLQEQDGLWWPARVLVPHPLFSSWDYDEDGEVIGFSFGNSSVPLERTLYYINDGDLVNNPEGTPLPQYAYWAWKRWLRIFARWNKLQERYAIPLRVVRYPAGEVIREGSETVSAEQKAAQIAQALRDYAYVSIPVHRGPDGKPVQFWDVQAVETGQVSNDILLEALREAELWMFRAMVAPKKLIEQETETGSYALAKVQADVFFLNLRARLRAWEASLWRVLKRALKQNFGKVDVEFGLTVFPERELALKLEIFQDMVRSGQVLVDGEALAKVLDIPVVSIAKPEKPETPEEEAEEKKLELQLESPMDALRRRLPAKVYSELKKKVLARAEQRRKALVPAQETLQADVSRRLTEWAEKKASALEKKREVSPKDLALSVPASAFEPILLAMRSLFLQAASEITKAVGKEPPSKLPLDVSGRWQLLEIGKREAQSLTDRLRFALYKAASGPEAASLLRAEVRHYVSVSLPRVVQSYVYMAYGEGIAWASRAAKEGRL